jgi:hypothetical protein
VEKVVLNIQGIIIPPTYAKSVVSKIFEKAEILLIQDIIIYIGFIVDNIATNRVKYG